jgi:hypothetical protein
MGALISGAGELAPAGVVVEVAQAVSNVTDATATAAILARDPIPGRS